MQGRRDVTGVRAIDVNASNRKRGFGRCEEEEGLVRVFGEVDDPEVGDQAKADGDGALDDVHVLPAPVTVNMVEILVDGIIDDATCGQDDDFTSL